MNCFSQEDAGGREPRPILARDGKHLDERTLAEFVANFDPQSGDCSGHLNCSARAWSTLKFSAGHPETGRHPPRFRFSQRSCQHQGRSSLRAKHTPTSDAACGCFALPRSAIIARQFGLATTAAGGPVVDSCLAEQPKGYYIKAKRRYGREWRAGSRSRQHENIRGGARRSTQAARPDAQGGGRAGSEG
jgi:hypothetical protein